MLLNKHFYVTASGSVFVLNFVKTFIQEAALYKKYNYFPQFLDRYVYSKFSGEFLSRILDAKFTHLTMVLFTLFL